MVTIANNVFGRGADFKTSFTVKEAGGLDQRTGGQGLPDILEQAANRAGRSGDPGTTGLDFSVEDPFLTNSARPLRPPRHRPLHPSPPGPGNGRRELGRVPGRRQPCPGRHATLSA